jgi:hypothetical protein
MNGAQDGITQIVGPSWSKGKDFALQVLFAADMGGRGLRRGSPLLKKLECHHQSLLSTHLWLSLCLWCGSCLPSTLDGAFQI